jgi:hypothetical protein
LPTICSQTQSGAIGSPEQHLTSKRVKGCWTLLANLRNEPKRQERKRGADLARARGLAGTRLSAARPHRVLRLNELKHSKPGFHIIHLFGAAGAILPLIVFSLEKHLTPYSDASVALGGFRVLVWPTSVLTAGIQHSHFTLTFLFAILLNFSIYLLVGCLVWLGLQPRSVVYLTFVGIMYLTFVSVAGFCEWLLP